MKKISERDAWLKIAAMWDKVKKDGDGVVVYFKGCPAWGLCHCIPLVTRDEKMYESMMAKIPVDRHKGYHGKYAWNNTIEGAKERAEFCRAEADKLKKKTTVKKKKRIVK